MAGWWLFAWCVAWLVAVGPVSGQPGRPAAEAPRREAGENRAPWDLWPTDKMIEMACDQIGRRYNLTGEQDAYTRALMTQRVKRFLEQYEPGIWELLTEAWTARLKGEPPGVETAKSWAERARPILESAKREILEGNREWREVLDARQQQIHDVDMRVMQENFRVTEERLDKWAGGGFDPAQDWYHGGLMGSLTAGEAATTQPREGRVGPAEGGVIRSEDYWEQYVKQFIGNYKLEESQAEAARSILRECRQRAAEYRRGQKEQFEKADAKVKAALATRPRDAVAVRAAYGEMRALNQPINELFGELKRRIEEIPTAAQKEAYGRAREERLAAMRAQWQERRERMRGGTTTQATTTQAAESAGPSSSQAAGR